MPDARVRGNDGRARDVIVRGEASYSGIKKGEPLVLRFRLNKARIYGLDFD